MHSGVKQSAQSSSGAAFMLQGEGCSTRADSASASVGEVALAVQALKSDVPVDSSDYIVLAS